MLFYSLLEESFMLFHVEKLVSYIDEHWRERKFLQNRTSLQPLNGLFVESIFKSKKFWDDLKCWIVCEIIEIIPDQTGAFACYLGQENMVYNLTIL